MSLIGDTFKNMQSPQFLIMAATFEFKFEIK